MSFSSALTSISTEQPELDHIVHLVPSGKLDQCVSAYKKLGFNVEKGGGEYELQSRLTVLLF